MNRIIFVILSVILVGATILLVATFGHIAQRSSTFQLKPNENTVLFAVSPWGDPRQMRSAYAPLLNYLTERTGKKFQLLIMENYEVAVENLVDKNIDIMVMSPVSYVLAKELDPNVQYIATAQGESNGKKIDTFEAYLIANKNRFNGWTLDRFIKNAKDISLGFVTKVSASGWSYPMAMFKHREIDPEKSFKSTTFYEIHPQATNAIASGKIDLAATWGYNLEQAIEKHGNIFEIVWTSKPIPGLCWAASSSVDTAFVSKVRNILNELNDSPLRPELTKSTPDKGWVLLDDSFYNPVREVMKYVGDLK